MVGSFATPLLVVLLAAAGLSFGGEEKKDPPATKPTEDEQRLLRWTNEVRADHELPGLKVNAILSRLAREHSANMARQGKMSHVLDGKDPAQRVREAGYVYVRIGENIAMSEGLMLEAVQKGWMDSKPHRENLLREHYREIGVGIARNEKGEVYYTQVFGAPQAKR